MEKRLVSVVIPCYSKQRQHLERAVASIKNQTYKNIEIIIIDDDNVSATEARNIGIKKVSGEYIAFLDADDEWNPSKIEKQMDVMLQSYDCPLVVCYSHDLRYGQDKINMPYQVTTRKMMLNAFNFSSTSTYLIRKYPLELINGFDESLFSAQEYDLAIRLTKHHNAICVPEVLVTQNSTDNQISTNWKSKRQGIKKVYEKHKTLFKKASVLNGLKLWGLRTFFSFGFLFGNRIYWFLSPMKKRYEVGDING